MQSRHFITCHEDINALQQKKRQPWATFWTNRWTNKVTSAPRSNVSRVDRKIVRSICLFQMSESILILK